MKFLIILSLLFFPILVTASPEFKKTVYQPPAVTSVQRVNFNQLAQQCANNVHHDTLQAIARVESGFNPFAIGVVRGSLKRQPQSYTEAVAAAKALHSAGKNFSMGLVQVNKNNLARYGLTYETVFDPCKNLATGAKILTDCYIRASRTEGGKMTQTALQKAFSCYYSGNFNFGFKRDFPGQPSYVQKVVNSAAQNSANTTLRVPAIIPAVQAGKSIQRSVPVIPYSKPQQQNTTQENPPVPIQRTSPSWDVFQEF
ncbi:MAG: lytic transglycosylase domain-containing protein [Snodgrassella sp.]|uniref:lytic transglycosylase domain-containing protein n=1 Tax=Snodgrassella sp. TaxID=2815304 RepID=UPI00258B1CC4|nr:lytic transglycosylase domain-containing protein [Snodgrassella sp.]MCO6520572.1 lytic transglycosylase domain-containing protein [Snodgrassella sp.]